MKATFVQNGRAVSVISFCAMLMICNTSQAGTILPGTTPVANLITSVFMDQGGRFPMVAQLLALTAGSEALAMSGSVPAKVASFADYNMDIITSEGSGTKLTVDNSFLLAAIEGSGQVDPVLSTLTETPPRPLAYETQTAPDLGWLIDAWPTLPPTVKRMILAALEAGGPGK